MNVESLRSTANTSTRYRFFWGHTARPDGALSDACFSQWWPCTFVADGETFTSTEQYMMAEKAKLFGDVETRAEIMAATDPKQVKALGRKVRSYDDAVWSAQRLALVTRGNVAKFSVEPLRAYLLETGDDVLVEASPLDAIWGIGLAADHPHARDPARWRGLNLLGFALMDAREQLRAGADRR